MCVRSLFPLLGILFPMLVPSLFFAAMFNGGGGYGGFVTACSYVSAFFDVSE